MLSNETRIRLLHHLMRSREASVTDIALQKSLPLEIEKYRVISVACVADSIFIEEYVRELKATGFSDVEVIDTKKDLNA